MPVLHTTTELMEMKRDDLDDLLLEPSYQNKANLRELLRRSLREAASYRQELEYEQQAHEQTKETIRKIQSLVD